MRISYFKYLSLMLLSVLLVLPNDAQAADLTITTYYPALSGHYERFRLVPRNADLPDPCVIGSLYVNAGGMPQYCRDNAGSGAWGSLIDVWTQNGDDIFLTDTPTNTQLKVGIGTKTPEFKLTLTNDAGIIATGTFGSGTILPDGLGAGSRLIWYPRKAAFRAGYVDGTQWDDANIGDYSTAMGKNSKASGHYSVVGGGDNNIASGQYSTVIGGQNNTASGDYSAITGGLSHTASGQYTTVTGGRSNSATANYATILGGWNNQATALYTTISGGVNNSVSTPYSNINGGKMNIIDQINGAATGFSVVGGGLSNQARNNYTVVSGGSGNQALAPYASVGGGTTNTAGLFRPDGYQACPMCPIQVGDILTGSSSRISGGSGNIATDDYSTISGGKDNTISGHWGTVGGGWQNSAFADYFTIGGGERNQNFGAYAMIMGGTDNNVSGDYSWAEGKRMSVDPLADRTFAWGYSDTPVSIATPDAFIIAPGTISGNPWNPKVGIRDTNPVGVLEINADGSADDYINIKRTASGDIFIVKNNGYIGIGRATPSDGTYAMQVGTNGTNGNGAFLTGGGVWTNTSTRRSKENIKLLSSQDAQNALDQLEPMTFHYKVMPEQNNAGFIAEDVPDIVAMKDRASLNTMDIVAVLTKAAQDQEQQIQEQKAKIKRIKNELRDLQKMLGE